MESGPWGIGYKTLPYLAQSHAVAAPAAEPIKEIHQDVDDVRPPSPDQIFREPQPGVEAHERQHGGLLA